MDDDTMLAMAGMAVTAAPDEAAASLEMKAADSGITGRFRVTPTGEIVLAPGFKDMRMIAGLRGEFEITADGEIRFMPDPDTVERLRMSN